MDDVEIHVTWEFAWVHKAVVVNTCTALRLAHQCSDQESEDHCAAFHSLVEVGVVVDVPHLDGSKGEKVGQSKDMTQPM